jgi:type II secretion system protein D
MAFLSRAAGSRNGGIRLSAGGPLLLAVLLLGSSLHGRAQVGMGTAPNPITPVTPGSFDYQNADLESLLDLYENLSGMRLVRDATIAGLPKVSVNMTGLTKNEMVRFIRAFLQLNGVSFVPIDEHTEKVLNLAANKNPRSEAPRVYARLEDLPLDDTVVTYFLPLDYVSPQEVVGIFQLTAPPHTYGQYVAAPTAQGVILTEEASVVRELVSLKSLIDVPPAKVTTEFISLNRADADTVVTELDKMLNIGPNGQPVNGAGPNGTVVVRPTVGNGAPMSDERNLLSGPANIVSDERSNRVVITTRPVNMPFLREIVAQLDQPAMNTVPQRFELRYVTAGDILPAIEAALAEGKDQLQQVKQDQQTAQTNSNRTGGATGGGTQQPQSSAGTGASSGGGTSAEAITPPLTAPQENDVPTVLTIGSTRLMADNHSNSIIVFGSPDVVTRVAEMVDELDRKPLQVYLRTVIGNLTVTKDMELGLDILQKFQNIGQGGLASSNVNSSGVTSPVAGPAGVGNGTFPEPRNLTAPNLFSTTASGLTLYGAIGSTLDAYLSALEATDKFKIISTPSVYTSNNKLAIIADGEQVPVPSSITSGFTTSTTNLTTTASVAYQNVLLQLDIIPLINANHEVTLQIRQTNNTLNGSVNISGNEVPNIDTQEINTEVTVKNNSTVVIGGLVRDTSDRNGSGIPWLSDIPVLGYLFGAVDKAKKREELIIMIQPTVVANEADQEAVDNRERTHQLINPDTTDAVNGVVPSLNNTIPWSPNSADLVGPMSRTTKTTTTTTTTVVVPPAGQTQVQSQSSAPYNSKGIPIPPPATTTTITTETVPVPRMAAPQLEPVEQGPSGPVTPQQ